MKVALLDVNVLIALAWPNHVHHELSLRWFKEQQPRGWATCPATQTGFVQDFNVHHLVLALKSSTMPGDSSSDSTIFDSFRRRFLLLPPSTSRLMLYLMSPNRR